MPIRVRCSTQFDITATGTRSHQKSSRMPFQDDSGRMIDNTDAWLHSRNRQRNWETLIQLISLRTFPTDVAVPVKADDIWVFEFTIEQPSSIDLNGDPVGILITDCRDVPMITGLDEGAGVGNMLVPGGNITFEPINNIED